VSVSIGVALYSYRIFRANTFITFSLSALLAVSSFHSSMGMFAVINYIIIILS